MSEQDKNTKSLVRYSIVCVTMCMLGSFVVSLNILDLLYLLFFLSFVIIYRLNK